MGSAGDARAVAMDLVRPPTWQDALAAKAARPGLMPLTGGTDVMVDLNFDRVRPEGLLDLTGLPELQGWSEAEGAVTLGAGVTYSEIISDLTELTPALALAARSVGSPQIRNRGTVAGNLGSASPAGDCHPPLLACGASVLVESVRGSRAVPVDGFFTGAKRHVLAPDELIRAVVVPVATGPQQFSKVGPRNAMVIAVASFALVLDPPARRVGTGLGSVGPTPLRARSAEALLAEGLDWDGRGPYDDALISRFAEAVAEAAAPIDDVRGTAAYRRRVVAVLARRALGWAWADYAAGAR